MIPRRRGDGRPPGPRPGRRAAAAALSAGLLALACASCTGGKPPPPPHAVPPAAHAAAVHFPPEGPVSLPFRPANESGVPYTLLAEFEGEREIIRSGSRREPEKVRQLVQLQLDYRAAVPVGATPEAPALLLLLDALRFESRRKPPGVRNLIEAADDRIRTMQNDKVGLDLYGAQPRERLTPRALLQRPFALLRLDAAGNPGHVLSRGRPSSRSFLRPLGLQSLVSYVRLTHPEGEVLPGTVWTASRLVPSPAARLGLELEIRYELAGYQKLDDRGCAWILLRGELDETDLASLTGVAFRRAVATLKGEAFVELATSRLLRLRLEDDVRTAVERGNETLRIEERARYRGTLALELRDPPADPPTWHDGSPRFDAP